MVMILQSLNNKPCEPRQSKRRAVQLASFSARDLFVTPAKRHPNVEQVQSQSHQQKTQGRIGRNGPTSNLIGTPVTGFNTKAIAVDLTHLMRGHIQMNENENLPHSTPLETLGSFGCGVRSTYDNVSRALLLASLTAESVLGSSALAPATQRARTATFAPTGARNDCRAPLFVKIVLHIDPCKPPSHQQILAPNFQNCNIFHQTLHDGYRDVLRRN